MIVSGPLIRLVPEVLFQILGIDDKLLIMQDTAEFSEGQVDQGRRREPRFESRGQGVLSVIGSPVAEWSSARVVDVSRSGLQVEMAVAVPAGSTIELRLQNVSVFGTVGSCREHAPGCFRFGVVTSRVISHQQPKSDGATLTS